MRTRTLLGVMCGVLLGWSPAPGKGEGSGGRSGGGGLGPSEAGGGPGGPVPPQPTGPQPTGDDPTGDDPTPVTTGPVGTTSGGSSSGDVADTGGQTTCVPDPAPDTECSFICDPDPPGQCGFVPCDPFAQDCPDGQKCAAFATDGGTSWNANKCVAITGDGAPGEPCTAEGGPLTGVDDCAAGVMCWNVDADNHGTCVALCTGLEEAPQCPDDGACLIANNGVLNLCLPQCDPLLQDCKANEVCVPDVNGFVCQLDNSGDEGQAHDPCEFTNACDPGLVCLDAAAASSACDQRFAGCCEPFCEFPDGACPAADQVCFQWFDPMSLPKDDPKLAIGVCVIPQ